jgi:hypothetical protein
MTSLRGRLGMERIGQEIGVEKTWNCTKSMCSLWSLAFKKVHKNFKGAGCVDLTRNTSFMNDPQSGTANFDAKFCILFYVIKQELFLRINWIWIAEIPGMSKVV